MPRSLPTEVAPSSRISDTITATVSARASATYMYLHVHMYVGRQVYTGE